MGNQKVVGWDIEIAEEIDSFGDVDHSKLGVTCAGIKSVHGYAHQVSRKRFSRKEAQTHVRALIALVHDGNTIVTTNGVGFDFKVLAHESGMYQECANLALDYHCDLMLMSVGVFGWRIGLDVLARGAGVISKLHDVRLNDGSLLSDMSGAVAPHLWAKGEYDAVLAYLEQDCVATFDVARVALQRGWLGWRSKKGRPYKIQLDGRLPTVREVIEWPLNDRPRPDNSWMDNPPIIEEICEWALGAA